MQLVFSSNNIHKIQEVQQLLGDTFTLLSLQDIGCIEDIPETRDTIEGNASLKSTYVFNKYGVNCFSDDTGLEIEALNGAPGVYSARYAGDHKSPEDNTAKVLAELTDSTNRRARFKTVVSLIIDGKEHQFEGIVNGTILYKPTGDKGFGYDPIFQPLGYNLSFAQISIEEKNKISHRALAVEKLVHYLKTL